MIPAIAVATHAVLACLILFVVQRVWLTWCEKKELRPSVVTIGLVSLMQLILINGSLALGEHAFVIPMCTVYLVTLGNLTALRFLSHVFKFSLKTERIYDGLIIIGYVIAFLAVKLR